MVEKSYIEKLIHQFWIPEWHILMMKNCIYNFENIDFFLGDVLKIKNYDDESQEQVKDLLIIEMLKSSMFLAEAFAFLAEALLNDPENLQLYLKEYNATKFYNGINSLSDDDYYRILSMPPTTAISLDAIDLSKPLAFFKEIIKEIRTFYFSNLDLFNSYKHSLRILPLSSIEEGGKTRSVLMYLCRTDEQNKAVVTAIGRDTKKYLEIAELISNVLRILLSNLENKLESPENWTVIFPAKTRNNGLSDM